MFGQTKAVGGVKKMMIALEKLAVPIKLMVSLGVDGPNINISIMEKLNKIKRERVFSNWLNALHVVLFLSITTVSVEVWRSLD